MSFSIDPFTTLPHGVRSTAKHEIAAALLEIDQLPADEAIHQLRKHCKKMRSLLRLVRAEIGDLYRCENAHYRTLADTLAGSRDAVSMRDALLELAPDDNFPQVLAFLETRAASQRNEEAMEEARALLQQGEARIDDWPLQGLEWPHAHEGYKRGYKRARRAMKTAFAQESAESFHEYRKRVKDHWYHSRLLAPVWKKAGKRTKALKELAQGLGDWHDLQLLRHLLALQGEHFGGELIPLLDSADQRLHSLRSDIQTLGNKLFADKKLRLGKRRA